jgi:hypothetical protein
VIFAPTNDGSWVINEANKLGMGGAPYTYIGASGFVQVQFPLGSFAPIPYINTTSPGYLDLEARFKVGYPGTHSPYHT